MIEKILIYGILMACLVMPVHAQAEVPQEQSKAVIIHYSLTGDVLTVIDSRVYYGHPPENLGHHALAVKILSRNNASLKEFGIADPRILYHESGADVLDTVNFSIIMPFYPAMAAVDVYSVDVYNRTPVNLMARADLTGSIQEFCDNHHDDRDCGGGSGSSSLPLSLIAGIAVIIILVLCIGWFIVKRKKPESK